VPVQKVESKKTLMESEKDILFLYQKSWFLIQFSIPISSLSCLDMIHGDGIIWMAFCLCPNQISCENTLEKQL